MNVVFLSPNYPPEMHEYTRGLAEVGVRVYGVGDTPVQGLAPRVREALTDYLQVPGIMDESSVEERVRAWVRGKTIDRLETNWEPLVLLAAKLRERLGVPGLSYDAAVGFRDKQVMKERLARAGLRVPHSQRVRSSAEALAAAERVGFPLILKPISGAGSADTYRCNDVDELRQALSRMQHVSEASCEEFVEGEEFTYDTVCIEGRPAYENVCQYLPRPLIARTNEWISPIICTVRDLSEPRLQGGLSLGRKVLSALGMRSGFTHMEWYKKENGEVVFGEIGCRPGGAHLVDQMNYTGDIDLFREWANAVCHQRFDSPTTRKYNAAIVFKRAMGRGRITRIEGLEEWKRRCGKWVAAEQLLPVGAERRNWLQTLVSDGFVIVRHPEWDEAIRMAEDAAVNIRMYAQ